MPTEAEAALLKRVALLETRLAMTESRFAKLAAVVQALHAQGEDDLVSLVDQGNLPPGIRTRAVTRKLLAAAAAGDVSVRLFLAGWGVDVGALKPQA